jgi:DNA-binding MarR family transcriptional regulator
VIPVTPTDTIAHRWAQMRPDLDTAPLRLFGRLRRLQALTDLDADHLLAGAKVTSPELDVLVILRHADQPMIARSIAALRGCSRAAMSNTLGRLETRGLVIREPNPADRRASLVNLSEEGVRLVDDVFPRRLAMEADLLAGLDPQEQEKISEALDLLLRAMLRRSPLDAEL